MKHVHIILYSVVSVWSQSTRIFAPEEKIFHERISTSAYDSPTNETLTLTYSAYTSIKQNRYPGVFGLSLYKLHVNDTRF